MDVYLTEDQFVLTVKKNPNILNPSESYNRLGIVVLCGYGSNLLYPY
jgi:hypothetical protein